MASTRAPHPSPRNVTGSATWRALLLFAALLLIAGLVIACGSRSRGPGPLRITSSEGTRVLADAGGPLEITIGVAGGTGPIDLTLLNPPSRGEFEPLKGAAAGSSGVLRTIPDPVFQGLQELVFFARTETETARLVVTIDTRNGVPRHQSALLGGVAYATQLIDVTGDGVKDIVSSAVFADGVGADRGAIHIWTGGGTLGTGDPDLTLSVTLGAVDNDRLGRMDIGAQGVRIADVTGDGHADIIACAPEADVGGTDRGAIYVWAGGPGLTSGGPDFALSVSGASDGDRLGSLDRGAQGFQLVDVTGDGVLDILAGADRADLGGVDRGAIYVWPGGDGLASGDPAIILTVSTAADGARLGHQTRGTQGILIADVTGDGVVDVLANAPLADRGGTNRGAVFVWAGGTGLATGDPDFVLEVTTGVADHDALGLSQLGTQGLWCVDVTGDGVLDVLALAGGADRGGTDRGAVYIWRGGATLTALEPDIVLEVTAAADGDGLGTSALGGVPIQFGDLDHDEQTDIVVVASNADLAGTDRGALYVWYGGSDLASGDPDAALQVSGASDQDFLGNGTRGALGFRLDDVTGDGRLDVIASAPRADQAGTNRGALYIWSGAMLESGDPDFTLSVGTGAADEDQLGANVNDSPGFILADVTDDGHQDLIVAAPQADRGGTNRGAVYIWRGGPSLATGDPDMVLEVTTGVADLDQLGITITGAVGLLARDVTGDGIPDVIAGASNADRGGMDRGAVYVWRGGTTLSTGEPDFSLDVTTDVADGDKLGTLAVGNQGIVVSDVSGDGIDDLLVAATSANRGGSDRGAVYVWLGGSDLASTGPDAVLEVTTGSTDGDLLGQDGAGGRGIAIGDVTGNGRPDLVVSAAGADLGGVNRGALYLWHVGSPTLTSGDPDAALTVSSAVDHDQLGRLP